MGIASRLAHEIYSRVNKGTETPAKSPEKKRKLTIEKPTVQEEVVISKEAQEARDRVLEQKRVLELSQEMDKVALEILQERLHDERISVEEKQTILEHMKALEVLKTGMMVWGGKVAGGSNELERYRMIIDGKPTSVFAKRKFGEEGYEYDEKTNQWFSVKEHLDEDQVVHKERAPLLPDDPNLAMLPQTLENEKQFRAFMMAATGLPADRLPMSDEHRSASRLMRQGYASYAEAAAHTLSLLNRSYHVPPTTLRETGGDVSSVQREIKNITVLTQSDEGYSILEQGAASPEFQKYVDREADHALFLTTDGYARNTAVHEGSFLDFDNGCTNGYAIPYEVKDPHGNIVRFSTPAEPFISFPMSIMADLRANDPTIKDRGMSDEKREKMRQSLAQLQSPDTREIKLLALTFRLLFERVDQKGKILPASTRLAEEQAGHYLDRLSYLVENGRPPELPESKLSKHPLEEMRKKLAWKINAELAASKTQ